MKIKRFMKKIVFYIPAILFAVVCGWLAISFGIGAISPIIFVWIALFLVSGFLLNKDRFLGGILGMLPGIHLIYMSTKYTGQVINVELSCCKIRSFEKWNSPPAPLPFFKTKKSNTIIKSHYQL